MSTNNALEKALAGNGSAQVEVDGLRQKLLGLGLAHAAEADALVEDHAQRAPGLDDEVDGGPVRLRGREGGEERENRDQRDGAGELHDLPSTWTVSRMG